MLRSNKARSESEGDDRSLRNELEDGLVLASEILTLAEDICSQFYGSHEATLPHDLVQFFDATWRAQERWSRLVPSRVPHPGNRREYRQHYDDEEEEHFRSQESKDLFFEVVHFLESLKGQECSMDRIGFQFGNAFNSRVRMTGRRNDGALRRWLESHNDMLEVVPIANTKNKATVRLISKNWTGAQSSFKGQGKSNSKADGGWDWEAKGNGKTKDNQKEKEWDKEKDKQEDSALSLLDEIVEYVTSQGGQVPLDKVGGRFGGTFNRMVRKTGSGNDGALRRWLSNHTDKVKIITDKTQKGGSGLMLQLTNPLQ